MHSLHKTIQAPTRVAGGCPTLLFRGPDLYVSSNYARSTGCVLRTHFTVKDLTNCHANVYLPANGDLEVLPEILDWVYPYLLLTPARVMVLTRDLNANCRWAPYLPVAPATFVTSSYPR